MQKQHCYNEAFPFREPMFNARERIHKNSVIMAEVKTNVIVSYHSKKLANLC